jgi:phage gpG-like protein
MPSETLDLTAFPGWLEAHARRLEPKGLAPLVKIVKQALVADTKENFISESDPDGSPWPARKMPRARGGDAKLLRDRGLLAASLSAAGNEFTVDNETDAGFQWGTNVDYAGIQQKGDTILPKGKALAIPLTRQAYNAGSPRKWTGPPLALVWPRGRSSGWLEERKTKGRGKGKLEVAVKHYLLVSHVEVPARPFIGIGDRLEKRIAEIVLDYGQGLIGGKTAYTPVA